MRGDFWTVSGFKNIWFAWVVFALHTPDNPVTYVCQHLAFQRVNLEPITRSHHAGMACVGMAVGEGDDLAEVLSCPLNRFNGYWLLCEAQRFSLVVDFGSFVTSSTADPRAGIKKKRTR